MSVLVTGGAGFIGSVAVERLLESGEAVVVLDNLSTGYRAAVSGGARWVEGSIQDEVLVRRTLEEHDVDTVMHFAAFIEVGESCANPGKYFENNFVGALCILRAMQAAGVKRFILSSTAAVYGDPESTPITETMPTRPKNPYGLSKRMVEQALEWHDSAYDLRYVALRYFNACGASEAHGEAHRPESHLIPNILMAAAGAKESVSIFGTDYPTPDGTCLRDYIHVLDLADAHILAMRHLRSGAGSDTFNLGNSLGHSVFEVVESAGRVTGRKPKVVYRDRRPGDADRLVASSEKARQVLGWRPSRGELDVIVSDAWRWYMAHPDGYGRT